MDIQYYPTPEALSAMAWAKFQNKNIVRLLEPSAGDGHLLKCRTDSDHRFSRKIIIDCCEIDINKHATLKSQGFNVVGIDFMQFKSGACYDAILMNPPFMSGCSHILKAWEILFEGEIVGIINAETLKNPYTRERKHLAKLIERHGSVEYLSGMFSVPDVERKTKVDIALIWLNKKSNFENEILGNILDNLRKDQASSEDLAGDYQETNYLVLPESFVENSVLMFEAALEATRRSIIAEARARKYSLMMGKTMEEFNGGTELEKSHLINNSTECSVEWVKETLQNRYSTLKNKAWTSILKSTKVSSKLSSKAQDRLESDFETIKHLEFTVQNIMGFLQGILDRQGDIQISMVCDVFDLISRYHSDNNVWFKGWKSNTKHRTLGMKIKSSRFIIPGNGVDSYHSQMPYKTMQMFRDIDKVFALLDGKVEPELSLESVAHSQFKNLKSSERVSGTYFDIRLYPKAGTIHFFIKNKKLIERMNRMVGNHRQWLPPADTYASEDFWKQYEGAEKFNTDFVNELQKRIQFKNYHRDVFWMEEHGDEHEKRRAQKAMEEAMNEVLIKHGINPEGLLSHVDTDIRFLECAQR
ncbi:DUF4942 domain-containing protein [Methylomonas sp. AM2-LC]|uniref:DUF4942 domain-containing protein n=1 Tax=Methylomonas sp. AM2-LC TaxID=3153301 RepID=UPI003264B022